MVKSWLVQDQTVLGKDYSNLLIADSLLKTIWFINAPCYGNEALASPKAKCVWSIFTDLKVNPTKHGRMTKPYSSPRFIANCFIADSYKDGHGCTKEDFHGESWHSNGLLFRSSIKDLNIIPLVGFCDEDDEMILVSEHQPTNKGSLDMYLSSPLLTRSMRLRICMFISSGLNYLHGPRQKIVCGDLKHARIHLDDDWNPKIGLSESFLMNEQLSSFNIFSNLGYVDPLYMETGRVTKEADVYTFGVILLEVLCGRQATTKDEETGWFLSRLYTFSRLACHHYENGTLTAIIDPILRLQINQDALNVFSAIAYRCLNMDPSIRPTARMLLLELWDVYKLQIHGQIPEIGAVSNSIFA
ncbi:jacalin-like lectin domain-containing protein [Tanacetum coccineum]